MIKNERQYRITKAAAGRFEAAISQLKNEQGGAQSVLGRAQFNAMRSQLLDLQTELSEYEALKLGQVTTLPSGPIDELPEALIKARITVGMSQKDLAARLGLKEQQVQRYEATGYSSASFDRIKSVIRVLGVSVTEEVRLATDISLV